MGCNHQGRLTFPLIVKSPLIEAQCKFNQQEDVPLLSQFALLLLISWLFSIKPVKSLWNLNQPIMSLLSNFCCHFSAKLQQCSSIPFTCGLHFQCPGWTDIHHHYYYNVIFCSQRWPHSNLYLIILHWKITQTSPEYCHFLLIACSNCSSPVSPRGIAARMVNSCSVAPQSVASASDRIKIIKISNC